MEEVHGIDGSLAIDLSTLVAPQEVLLDLSIHSDPIWEQPLSRTSSKEISISGSFWPSIGIKFLTLYLTILSPRLCKIIEVIVIHSFLHN